MASDFGCPLTVFAVGADAESAQSLEQDAKAFLAETGPEAVVRTIVLSAAEDLSQAILDAQPGTLVLDRLSDTAKKVDIVALLARSAASLLLRN